MGILEAHFTITAILIAVGFQGVCFLGLYTRMRQLNRIVQVQNALMEKVSVRVRKTKGGKIFHA